MPRVLLTGAGGFLAAPLAERLAARRTFLARHSDYELTDCSEARALVRESRPSLVFYLAGRTRPGSWDDFWRSHVTATANQLAALASSVATLALRVDPAALGYRVPPARGLADTLEWWRRR